MSRIESVRIHRRALPLRRPFVTAVRSTSIVDAVIVELIDSDGRRGWGEAPTSWRVTGESPQSVTAAVEGPLAEAVAGRAADDPDGASDALARSLVRNSAARMAVDCALYDLAAQGAGVPLHRYLGGAGDPVRTDMTLSAVATDGEVPGLAGQARGLREDGFTVVKVKVGAGADDVAAMRAVRDAVGPDTVLRADANQAWDAQRAVRIIRAWEDAGLGVQLVEQPVHRDDLDGLAFVTAHVGTPVLADESVWTTRDAREVIARRAAGMINIKLAKTGGIREALRLLRCAEDSGVGTIVGCMMESSIGISAAAAVAAVIDAGPGGPALAHDLDAGLWLTGSPAIGGATYLGDEVRPAPEPGLGIAGLRP